MSGHCPDKLSLVPDFRHAPASTRVASRKSDENVSFATQGCDHCVWVPLYRNLPHPHQGRGNPRATVSVTSLLESTTCDPTNIGTFRFQQSLHRHALAGS